MPDCKPVMKPARRSRQQIQALLKLREFILTGVFAPGQRVSELAVVDKLGISRTPVRLALTMLEHEGFLETLPGGGFRVQDFSAEDVQDAIEIRGMLEGMAARIAAERRPSSAALAAMRKTVDALDEVVRDGDPADRLEPYIELNETFHSQLLDAADSTMIRRSMAHIESLPFASPNAFVLVGVEAEEEAEILKYGQVQHRLILEAICQGEGGRAEALAREHARLARGNLSTALSRSDLLGRVPGAALLRRDTGSQTGSK